MKNCSFSKRRNRIIILLMCICLSINVRAFNTDEEDEILDEIIPHTIMKRKFTSLPKRQFIQAPSMGQEEQFVPLPQGEMEQFAGGAAEFQAGKMDQFQPSDIQQQAFSQTNLVADQQGVQDQMLSQPQEMQTIGQQQAGIGMQDLPASQVSQQTTNEGIVTEMPENAKNYNTNAVIETSLADNGYKVTTDTREKASNLAKDVKNFGLWEYSADNTAASTDQTAKILQSKLEEADALLKGKDSASLNPNQMENAQGSKVDDILSLFNKDSEEKNLENFQGKGLEALDGSSKGLTALGMGDKNIDLLGTGKSSDGQLGESDAALVNDVGAVENSLGGQSMSPGGNNGLHEGVSVVNIPNTFSLEDEHGNKLDSALSGSRKSEKQKAMQFLKNMLKKKLESQAIKMLLKQKKLQAALRPSTSPTKSLKEQLSMFINHKDQASVKAEGESSNGPKISKLDVKLLSFIKGMLKKGINPEKHKGLTEDQLKLFMSALNVMSKNGKIDETEEGKQKEAEDETDAENKKDDKAGKNEAESITQKEEQKEDAEKENGEKTVDGKENKQEKEDNEGKKKERAKKLKEIQSLLEHVKPTSRASHAFFMDEDQPLSDSEGMSSNSLMKYLEHETALLDQFQEGSQISDPALQLKQLAGLMMRVANKAQAKDEYISARRTTVKPTDESAAEGGQDSENDEKGKGERKEKDSDNGNKDNEKESNKENEKEKSADKSKKITEKEEGREDKDEGKKKQENEKEVQQKINKESKEKDDNNTNNDKNISEKEKDKKDDEKMKKFKGNENETEKENKNERQKDTKNETEKIKEVTKVEGTKQTENGLEKIAKDKDDESSKAKESKNGEDKESKDESKHGNDEKIKQLKSLHELSKLRNSKKIVNKVDGNTDEKSTAGFKGNQEDADHGTEEQTSKPEETNSGKYVEKDDGKTGSKSESDVKNEKSKAKDDEEKGKGAVNGEAPQDTTEQFDLYVGSKSNKTRPLESQLKPQLPFLNPGSAHLDVLENDASLKQYLMKKGDKDTGLRNSKVSTNQKGGESESFDDKESDKDRLLQLKDVTQKGAGKKGKGENAKPGGYVNTIKTAKVKPNIVPPAGQGNPLSSLKVQHALKPMSRLQLQKYQQLMKYKKLMGERNRQKISTGLMERGTLRHIAPALADRLVDASSIRLAALARLISMAKRRQKVIDVTASKKTLPSSKFATVDEKVPMNLSSKMTSSTTTSPVSSSETAMVKSLQGAHSSKAVSDTSGSVTLETPVTKSKFVEPVMSSRRSKSVLVPSRKQVIVPSFANTKVNELEARPADETSSLLSKAVVVAEHDNGVDPADVTRSKLSKPDRPSIKQVMTLLGNRNGQSGSENRKIDGNSDGRSSINNADNKMSGQIVRSFFKQPTQSTSSIKDSIKEIGNILKSNIEGKDSKTAGKTSENAAPAGNDPTRREKIDADSDVVSKLHKQEAGISSIQKQNVRSIVKTLKSDASSANLLLRKRNEIPRVRRKFQTKKRNMKRVHS